MVHIIIMLSIICSGCVRKYPAQLIETTQKEKFDNAKWFMYQTHFDSKARSKEHPYEKIDILSCNIDLNNIYQNKDTLEFSMFFTKDSVDYVPAGKEFYCRLGFIEKVGNKVAYRQPCGPKIHLKPTDGWVHQMLLPKDYNYQNGEHQFDIEEKNFKRFLIEHKSRITNKWLIKEAKRRGIF